MKRYIFLAACLLTACQSQGLQSGKDSITGMYVHAFQNEYYTGNDTLVITWRFSNHYSIVKNTGYQNIPGDKPATVKHLSKQLSGIYHEQDQQLFEQREGMVFSIDAANGRLFLGNSEYKKIK